MEQVLKLSEIVPYENNARKNDKAVKDVAESIKQCGYIAPIIVDENNVILAGHTRYKALKKLGYKEITVRKISGLTDEQKRKYRLLDNKTNELADWDFEKLKDEIDGLDFSEFDIDWGLGDVEENSYEQKMQEFHDRMEAGELSEDSEEYQEFLSKFEAKKTTDDCYTPPNVYEVVADYVAEHYGVDKNNFMRPFVPNGDYKKEKYTEKTIVVDNPPFSIISEICRWYQERGIKFFMFAPTLTIMGIREAQKVVTGNSVTYENGAKVNTSFVTNMDEYEIRSAPNLYKKIKAADDENLAAQRKDLPIYDYPLEVVRQTTLGQFSKYGIEFAVKAESCYRISELDEQKAVKKGIFGSGYLISEKAAAEKAAAEKAAAEKAAAEKWQLSDREREIIKKLK